jgi:hypothetical protein
VRRQFVCISSALIAIVFALVLAAPYRADGAPQPGSPAAANPMAAYTVEVSTNCGQSLLTHKPDATSVKAALEATFPDLAAYFGSNPTVGPAFQAAKDPNTGGATFSATLSGQAIKGIITCKIRDKGGATVAVVYGVADAPKVEWDKLVKPVAPPPAGPANANIAMKEYDFPDGTGKIGIPDGWTMTNGQSELHPCAVKGPADQVLFLHTGTSVARPDSPQVQNRRQIDAQRSRMGAPPLPPLLVAPLTDPVEALQNLLPQLSRKSEMNNGPSMTLDKIISSQDLPSQTGSGKRSIITYAFTKTLNGQASAFRAQVDLLVSPGSQGSVWMYYVRYSASAPDATFEQDLPTMLAIVRSDVPNGEQAIKVGQQENKALWNAGQTYFSEQRKQELAQFKQFQADQNRRFEIGQEQHDAAVEAQADRKSNFDSYELGRSRNSADFEQTVLGYETVQNTKTGQSGTADMSNVDGVVNSLNALDNDPTEWKKVPLRDEMFPLP